MTTEGLRHTHRFGGQRITHTHGREDVRSDLALGTHGYFGHVEDGGNSLDFGAVEAEPHPGAGPTMPTVYDVWRALQAGRGATIAHPTDGSRPWTLEDFLWTPEALSLRISREGDPRPHTVSLVLDSIVRQ